MQTELYEPSLLRPTLSRKMDPFVILPTDTLYLILSFLSAREIDTNVSPVCRCLWELTASPKLWKQLCATNGKKLKPNGTTEQRTSVSNRSTEDTSRIYRDLYYSNPCVPTDYKTIRKALEQCQDGNEVVLLPGIYYERILIGTDDGRAQDENTTETIHVNIRAAFAEKGSAIAFLSSTAMNEACIHIRGNNVRASIKNVQILHSVRGNDLWSGNSAIFCEDGAQVSIHGCKITSESGRGVVLLRGSQMTMSNSTIADCAATGCYVSDVGTTLTLTSSNIVRNGTGSRRSYSTASLANFTEFVDVVPPGHSGLYIESATSVIKDCLISGNALTGVSVVRNGSVRISKCDLTQNGEGAAAIEPVEGDQEFLDISPEGLALAELEKNNRTSRPSSENVLYGGLIRQGNYSALVADTLASLENQYILPY